MTQNEARGKSPLIELAEFLWTQEIINIMWDDAIQLALKLYDASYRLISDLPELTDEEAIEVYDTDNPTDDHTTGCLHIVLAYKAKIQEQFQIRK